ncbi:hypothetical protein JVX98_13330 [Ensifer sp. PDNC004]|uniref:hypothetical protein n=1 Tax=Ensifer sp. PDNC004 TaxID=2811423 RepID=UPI0019631C39|nr:hypothetical protein [Ensifer sp. PDNC004]QRY69197.1 hypothetical protein JVX98_13330 [Ensifer sp. PDNC004]
MSENQIHERGIKAMSTAVAAEYVKKMVARETAGNGDVENAVRRLARKHGLSFWQIMHLRAGRAKSITVDAFTTIRRAYLEYCEAEIRALQHEIQRDRDRYESNDDLQHLEAEAQALAEKVRLARERIG